MAIIGLKTSMPNTMLEPNELDALFSDDSDSGSFSLDFVSNAPNTLPPPALSLPLPPPVTATANQVRSLEEVLPRITSFLSKMKELSPPKKYLGDIFFIPENAVPLELSSLLSQLYRDENDTKIYEEMISSDFSTYPDTVLAQVELLRYKKDKSADLEQFLDKKVDSRIISLIHYVLSAGESDSKVAVFHLVSAIEEMLKFPMLAPISVFFPEFSVAVILKQLAVELVSLFPRNPILPSCIENMSEFSEEAKLALDLIPESDDDSSDDFSSDFFESLRPSSISLPVIVLQNFNKDITNILDFESDFPKPITTVTEPPTTVSFMLENGGSQMAPMKFKEWIQSLRTVEYNDDLVSQFMQSKDQAKFCLKLPENPDLSQISYVLPVIHIFNGSSPKFVSRGAPFPKLLRAEFEVQQALSHNNSDLFNKALSYFASITAEKESIEIVERIKPIEELRVLPGVEQEENEYLEAVLAVSDFEIALHGRSLFNFAPISKTLPDLNVTGMISNNHWRSKFLYTLYTKYSFSPYISYRIAFAIALNLIDRDPQMASNFLFECIYVLLSLIPLHMSLIIRSTYLVIAEIFNQTNSYYYAALIIDNFFLFDVKDATYSTSLARMAMRNCDYLRSTYHYTQSLKHYISRKMSDESLYIAQLISTIYAENGLNYLAISLLSAMLYKSYSLNFGFIQPKNSGGTLQNKRSKPLLSGKPSAQQFAPNPHSLNTSLLALTLTDLLLSERMFDIAQAMLNSVQESRIHIKRLVSYMQSRFLMKQNRFIDFLTSIPRFEVNLNRKSNPRLSILAASTFDTNSGYLRMLANMNFTHLMFSDALFWSEIIIHNTCKGSMKEFGYGNLIRGKALYEIWIRANDKRNGNKGVVIAKQLNALQEPFGKFICPTNVKEKNILSEALSSFFIARLCFDHVGCFHLYAYSSILFCDIFLNFAFNQNQNSTASIEIKPPTMMTELLGAKEQFQLPVTFESQTITIDTIQTYLNSVETVIAKSLSPIDIIHHQVLQARYNYLKGKTENSIRYFDYSFKNIQKYFVCGCEFIPRFFSLKKQHRIHLILQNMVQLLFMFDAPIINDRLTLFDILNDVRMMMSNKRKSKEILNTRMISPKIDVLPSFTELINPNFPDFDNLLRENHLLAALDTIEVTETPTIDSYIDQISANIRLYEAEKIREDDMIRKNRKLCQKIEIAAETIRRQHQTELPAETQYSFVVKQSPKVRGLVFVLRFFDKVGVYVPETGEKRYISIFKETGMITLKLKSEIITEEITGLFNSQFTELIFSLTSIQSKAKNHASHVQKEIASKLFGKMLKSKQRPNVADTNLLGGSKVFGRSLKGALATLDCGTEPVVIVSSIDLQCLPYETILKPFCVIRSFSYTRLAMRSPTIPEDMVPMIIRSRLEDPGREVIPINEFLYTFGGRLRLEEVNNERLCETKVLPLFFSNQSNEYYSSKYEFCTIVDNGKMVSIRKNNVVICSYADLCEMPTELERRMKDFMFASFMFVPNSYFKIAMKMMRRIYRRHEKRVKYGLTHKKEMEDQLDLIHDRYKLLTTIQATLISTLHVPVPLFTPVT